MSEQFRDALIWTQNQEMWTIQAGSLPVASSSVARATRSAASLSPLDPGPQFKGSCVLSVPSSPVEFAHVPL